MYTAEDIQARLREKPFRPFRIIASEGLRYDIRHPDLVFVGRHDLQIGFAKPESPTIYDSVTRVALLHVVALEDLPPQPAATGNSVAAP
jgi:hypothetical protein